MMRTRTPAAALQKTYDDCHLVCSTAIYFESQNNEVEALRCWKNALEQINYHKAFRIPSTYHPKTETERALQASLRDLELQCKERVDLLGALDRSRKDVSGNSVTSDNLRPLAEGENESWLGSGTIPPLDYPDLARPPALPIRPPQVRSKSSENATLPKVLARPASPSPIAKSSRTPSPEKKMRMRSTLRPSYKPRITSSSSSFSSISKDRPPSAAKAATLAWTSIAPPQIKTSEELADDMPTKVSSQTDVHAHSRTPKRVESRQNRRRKEDERGHAGDSTAPLPQLGRLQGLGQSPGFMSSRPDATRGAERNRQPSSHLKYSTEPPSANTAISKSLGKQALKSDDASHSLPDPPKRHNTRPSRYSSAEDESLQETSDFVIPRKPIKSRGIKTSRAEVSAKAHMNCDLGLCSDDEIRESEPCSSESGLSGSDTDEKSWKRMATRVMATLPRGVDPSAAEQILNEVIIQGDEVHWGDIAGLEVAKSALKETVVYPFLRPDLFMGLREPARGMLLFGPPGTGKTMLARAVATESKSTFFAISASSLTSKFLGESEKLVRALFILAKMLAPSIIFVDEIDSLLSARNESGEHEASRRIKTEFLIQWSDLARAAAGRDQSAKDKEKGDASRVLVLAATNSPWTIDDAARRRFVRRQYIPLPEDHVRHLQLKTLLAHQKHQLTDQDIAKLVELTDGFSGSDITALAKDAAMGPLRSLGEKLLHMTMDEIGPIHLDDFVASLGNIRPSVSKEGLQRFEDWARNFGERGG